MNSRASTYTDKADLGLLQRYADLLDSSIRIPGTTRTIGMDPILGLIPVVGDIAGYLFSLILLYKTVRMGASKMLILKMLGNAFLDASIGSIPVVGMVFDFAYKSNERNLRLFREYHEEGKHNESTLPIFIAVVFVSLSILLLMALLIYKLVSWMF